MKISLPLGEYVKGNLPWRKELINDAFVIDEGPENDLLRKIQKVSN